MTAASTTSKTVDSSEWIAAFTQIAPSDYEILWSSGPYVSMQSHGVRVRAKHECGAVTELDIDADDIRWNGVEEQFIKSERILFGSCSCVRREVVIHCTHQRCEP